MGTIACNEQMLNEVIESVGKDINSTEELRNNLFRIKSNCDANHLTDICRILKNLEDLSDSLYKTRNALEKYRSDIQENDDVFYREIIELMKDID